MRKTMIRRGTGVLLALLLIVSLLPAGVLAESRNEFGIERYVALGDSFAAGLNEDKEIGGVPKIPTGELDEDGEEEMVEVFGTSQTGYATRLARMLNLSGAGRLDQNRPDDGYRSWAYCGMRTKDLRHYLDPSFPHDDNDPYFQWEGVYSNYQLYLKDIAEDVRNADLITLGIGGNDFFTAPLTETVLEMQDEAETEEETLALQQAELLLQEEQDGNALEQITELLDTMGLLVEILPTFLTKMRAGYAEMAENFPAIVELLRQMNPDAQILLDHVPNPLSGVSVTGSSVITLGQILGTVVIPANLLIDATAEEYGCEVVETVDVPIGDALHPTNEGYQLIAQRSYDKLRAVEHSFRDVEKGLWYEDAVNYVSSRQIMTGTGADTFSPYATVTRGMVAQTLYAQEGRPGVTSSAGFRDVPEGKWYSDAVNWCVGNHLAAGYTDNTFRPEQAVTRQQFIAILYQHALRAGKDTSQLGRLTGYADGDAVEEYARPAMKWALGHRLITGTDRRTLDPTGKTTRAQMAVILKAYDQMR